MKKLFLSITLLFSLTVMFANNSNENEKVKKSITFKGKVTDNVEGLVGVKIIVDNKTTEIYTDFDGNFEIPNLSEGYHKITFDYVTYNRKEIVVDTNKQNGLEVNLEQR